VGRRRCPLRRPRRDRRARSRARTNHLSILAAHDDEPSLRAIVAEARDVLAVDGDTFTEFPEYLPDGTTPIDADIRQVSTLIGMLGVMAGSWRSCCSRRRRTP
jgi:hypothetical protein